MTAAIGSRRRRRGAPIRRTVGQALVLLLLGIGGLIALVPFYWLLRSSVMQQQQILLVPPVWIPNPVDWSNFAGALSSAPFGLYFANTLFLIVLVVPGTLFSTSTAAFAFSRVSWKGRNVVFALLMSSLLLPGAVTLIPTFIAWQSLGYVGTYVPLVLPAFFFTSGAGFNVFLLRQFFLQVPRELDQAIYLDGGTPLTVYKNLMLPLNKGPLTLVAIFTTIGTWNDLLNPLIYLSDPNRYTLSLGLAAFKGVYQSQWGYLMAASVLVLLPILVLFFFAQRYIIEGVTLTGLKG